MTEEATESLLPLAEKHGVTIKTSSDMSLTIGSQALLLQLTTNLVHNAIVHDLPEQGAVWVTTSAHPKHVMLTVENTGEKIAPQTVSMLVEPFQRGTQRMHTDHAGVGLGVAIARASPKHTTERSFSHPARRAGFTSRYKYPSRRPHGQMTACRIRRSRRGSGS